MRLWTFQRSTAWESIQKYSTWYANFDYADRLKLVDEQYIQEDFKTPEGVYDTMPIYCFASMGEHYPNLCLGTMYGQYSHLVGWMQFPLERMVMLELEVPESFILSSKCNNKWYVAYPGMPEDVPKKDKWKYAQVVDEDEIELHNHLTYKRKIRGDDVECLIPYISKDHIAAVRVFKPTKSKHAGYNTCKVETIYTGKEVPLWTVDIYCNGDGYPRLMRGGELVVGSFNDRKKMQLEHGMYSIYPYMTMSEVFDCCHGKVLEIIRNIAEKKNLEWVNVKDLTLAELQAL